MKYANLIYETEITSKRLSNAGNQIQQKAIENLYSYMGIDYDREVYRLSVDEMFSYNGNEYLILPINWPFYGVYRKISSKIIPVYLGLNTLSSSLKDSLKLKEFEPIGCRDYHSMCQLRNAGIEAYLGGCMTLTLPRIEYNKRGKVFIVDGSKELLDIIPKEILEGAEKLSHVYYDYSIDEQSAMDIFERYKKEARLIITSRLHCAVPCVAYGIPVIFAPNRISYRCAWLHNIIPLYEESTFQSIEWNPKPVDIEFLKQRMLSNAANRVRMTWDKYVDQLEISEFFEKDAEKLNIDYEDMSIPIQYMKDNWELNSNNEYIIWGITQTAERLYSYIKENYPDAKLTGVIDLYRKEEFLGCKPVDLSILRDTEAVVFVAAESINAMAIRLFSERPNIKYCLCWKNRNYDYSFV